MQGVTATVHAISILRVSTLKQKEDGDGLENQRRYNREYIERRKYKFTKEFELAESASIDHRLEFDKVMDYTIANKDKVNVWVMYKVDRLSRGGLATYVVLKQQLKDMGVKIEFSTQEMDGETPEGELMENMLACMARFENRLKTQRTIGVEKILANEGYWCRSAPTGFVNDRDIRGKPILKQGDPVRWNLIQQGFRMQLSGLYTITEVVTEMRRKGLTSRTGKLVYPQHWTKMLRSPVYGGWIREVWTEGKLVEAKFDGVISRSEWCELQDILDGRKKHPMATVRKKHNPDFPLRQFMLCPYCAKRVRGSPAKSETGRIYRYYFCRDKACRFNVQTKEVHALFEEYLEKIRPTPELISLFKKVVLHRWAKTYDTLNQETQGKQKEVTQLEERKRKLVRLIEDSADDVDLLAELRREFKEVSNRHTMLTTERNATEQNTIDAQVVVDYCCHFLEHAHKLWQEASVEDKSRLQSLIFPEGVSYDALTGKQTPKLSPVYAAMEGLKKGDTTLAAPGRIELPLTD